MAFDANALDRETRGFISITTTSPLAGFTANCTFDPPVSTPTRRIHAKAASRMIWYSTSLSVCAGATVMESPVCTPIGSKFSIEQMMTQLSAVSRMTSSSYSFQPAILFSIKISLIGLASRPFEANCANSSAVFAIPVPRPPKMYAGRMIAGRPMVLMTSRASSMLWAMPLSGTFKPISIMAFLNFSRSSAVEIDSALAPISSGVPGTPTRPRSNKAIAKFRPVCPPSVGRTASGFSRSMIFATTSQVNGSMYVRSAKSGSVMIVAGFEFAKMTR